MNTAWAESGRKAMVSSSMLLVLWERKLEIIMALGGRLVWERMARLVS